MYFNTTGKAVFSGNSDSLDRIADYCDSEQLGNTFFDEELNALILTIDEDFSQDGKDGIINFVTQINEMVSDVEVSIIGTISDRDVERSKSFECQCKLQSIKYRETDWQYDAIINEDLSYEEYEEETHRDLDEDEYDEYVHRAHSGISNTNNASYGDWEYIEM